MDYFDGPPRKQQRGEYRCDVCNTAFNHRRTLLRHQRENAQHLERMGLLASERPVCQLCYRSFSRPLDLMRHQSQVHDGQKRPVARASGVDQPVPQESMAHSMTFGPHEPQLYHGPASPPRWSVDSKVLWYDYEPSSDTDMLGQEDGLSLMPVPPLSLHEIWEIIHEKDQSCSESPGKTIMLVRKRSSSDYWDSLTPASEASDSWIDMYFQDAGGTRHKFWSCELISGIPLPILALPTVVVLRQERALCTQTFCVLLLLDRLAEYKPHRVVPESVSESASQSSLRRAYKAIESWFFFRDIIFIRGKGLCLHLPPAVVILDAFTQCEKCSSLGDHDSWRQWYI